MYVIFSSYGTGGYVFGNKSLTDDKKLARQFESEFEAWTHIYNWFVVSSDFTVEPA